MTFEGQPLVVCTEIFSRRSWRKPVDMFLTIRLFDGSLPLMRPNKWGWYAPLKHIWGLSNFEKFIPDDRGGNTDTIHWKRTLNPSCKGNFYVSWKSAVPEQLLDTHSHSQIVSPLAETSVDPLLNYIQSAALSLDIDIAYVHMVVDQEQDLRTEESRYSGGRGFQGLELSTHTLRHWLPELPWAVVFGQAYVRMFGLERLLNAPAYMVKKLSDEAVYLQLSPKLTDLIDDYAAVDAVRQNVKNHIGRDAFFDVSKAYSLRGPVNESGICTPEEIINFKPPPPIGTVFRVPDFQLIPD